MSLTYVPQSITDLRFAVYHLCHDRSDFHVLAEKILRRRRYQVELWVIGSSHVLNVITPDSQLAEVMMCSLNPLPATGLLWRCPDLASSSWAHHDACGIDYKAVLHTLHLEQQPFVEWQEMFVRRASKRGLTYHFPLDPDSQLTPVTAVEVLQCTEETLEIRTLHSYVYDLTLVWTHSTLRFDGRLMERQTADNRPTMPHA